MPHECFADEIAIDFPSVEPVVERMRNAFLGQPAETDVLTTALRLSARQALGGVVVPVDVPIRVTCVRCGGRGETWTEPCNDCSGTGTSVTNRAVHVTLPPGIADGARLRFRVSSPGAAPLRVEVRIA